MNIGARIKEIRKEMGMSQEELAEKIKISKHSIKKYEAAQYINLETLEAISNALNVNIVSLIVDDRDHLFDLYIKQYNLTHLDSEELDKLKIEFEFALGYIAYKYDDRK